MTLKSLASLGKNTLGLRERDLNPGSVVRLLCDSGLVLNLSFKQSPGKGGWDNQVWVGALSPALSESRVPPPPPPPRSLTLAGAL